MLSVHSSVHPGMSQNYKYKVLHNMEYMQSVLLLYVLYAKCPYYELRAVVHPGMSENHCAPMAKAAQRALAKGGRAELSGMQLTVRPPPTYCPSIYFSPDWTRSLWIRMYSLYK